MGRTRFMTCIIYSLAVVFHFCLGRTYHLKVDLKSSPAGYIGTSISDGPGCLMLRCPDPSCSAAVGQDMINVLASDEDKEKYSRYLLRSYIEDNRKVHVDSAKSTFLPFLLILLLLSEPKIKRNYIYATAMC